jgi:hypothetical protein
MVHYYLLNGDEILVDGESESSVHTKPRPMKVTFTNTDVKKSFMKQLSKLKDIDESSPFKNISISHYLLFFGNASVIMIICGSDSSLMKRALNSSNLFMKLSALV